MSLNKYLISLVLIFFILPSSYADQVVVTDGDTIRIDGERIRFSGIDAPELKQTCLYQDIEFQCG